MRSTASPRSTTATRSLFEYCSLPPSLLILRDAAERLADQQVRNRGTMGGSIANADPGGDWAPVLLACGAKVDVVGTGGQRSLGIEHFFIDAYTTALTDNEIVRRIRIPVPGARTGNVYVPFKRRAGDIATASAAVRIDLDESGACTDAAVALGNVGPKAALVATASELLRGRSPLDSAAASLLGSAAAEACDLFGDTSATAAYKRSLVKTLVMRALDLAARRAQGEVVDVGQI